MKRYVVMLAVMALLMVALAVPAFAQGKFEQGPEHARSICSFSGLNDEPDDPEEGGRTQSYGQEVKKGNEDPSGPGRATPGFACNPTTGPSGPFPQE
ncbi:MAG: hypothetical protein H0U04_07990 [Rubrobacter sp.]|nr:hypothetical protein [Rubrobacter sp.]